MEPVNPDPEGDDLVDAFHLNRYRKAITALVLGLLGWGLTVVTSDPSGVTGPEWIGLGFVLAVVIGVERVPNAS